MTDPRPDEFPEPVPAPDNPPVQPDENPAPNPAVPNEGDGQEGDRQSAGQYGEDAE